MGLKQHIHRPRSHKKVVVEEFDYVVAEKRHAFVAMKIDMNKAGEYTLHLLIAPERHILGVAGHLAHANFAEELPDSSFVVSTSTYECNEYRKSK
jgi:hypothetical protein